MSGDRATPKRFCLELDRPDYAVRLPKTAGDSATTERAGRRRSTPDRSRRRPADGQAQRRPPTRAWKRAVTGLRATVPATNLRRRSDNELATSLPSATSLQRAYLHGGQSVARHFKITLLVQEPLVSAARGVGHHAQVSDGAPLRRTPAATVSRRARSASGLWPCCA